MTEQFQASLSDELINNLLDGFPQNAPRDIKMLFRLALSVTTTKGEPLDIDLFRRCGMFRATSGLNDHPNLLIALPLQDWSADPGGEFKRCLLRGYISLFFGIFHGPISNPGMHLSNWVHETRKPIILDYFTLS